MKIYCSACGHPNAYTAKKPKFCNECGVTLGSTHAKATTSPVPEAPKNAEEALDEDVEFSTTLGGLEVEIEPFGKVRGIDIEDIASMTEGGGMPPSPDSPKKKGGKTRKRTAKQLKQKEQDIKNWLGEAGTMRRKNND